MASKKLTHVLLFPQSVSVVPKLPLPVPSKKLKRPKSWNSARLFVVEVRP
jgi:hypothetical protein